MLSSRLPPVWSHPRLTHPVLTVSQDCTGLTALRDAQPAHAPLMHELACGLGPVCDTQSPAQGWLMPTWGSKAAPSLVSAGSRQHKSGSTSSLVGVQWMMWAHSAAWHGAGSC